MRENTKEKNKHESKTKRQFRCEPGKRERYYIDFSD